MKEEPAKFPMPGDQILGGTVVASVWYNEDDYEWPLATVLLLMPEAPYYRVGVVWLDPDHYRWNGDPAIHRNIVPAVDGDEMAPGYADLGGDY